MGRPLRNDAPGTWFHVVNRGVARGTIFYDERDRFEFERLLGVAHDRFGVEVHAFCWMTNHYHLLLECPTGGLSDAMHLVGSLYVRHVNDRRSRDGPLFRDRFYSKPVTSDAYLVRLVRYIHRNPLAFVAPERLVDYRASSLRVYLGHRRAPAWMSTETVLEACGGRDSLARAVLEPGRVSVESIGAADMLQVIELMIDEHDVESRASRTSRTVASLLLDRLDGDARALLAAQLSFPTGQAQRAARARARRQLASRPELATIVDAVLDLAA